jgi:RES domain-containing protein
VAIELHIPDSIRSAHLSAFKLPRNWRKYPAPTALQKVGNAWLDAVDTCIMRVPSAVIPTESNVLINPRHPDVKKIKVSRKFEFRFDPRLVSH